MTLLHRWWGWAIFVALLAGVGAALHAVLPPAPRLRIDHAIGVAVSDDGKKLATVDSPVDDARTNVIVRIWDVRSGRVERTVAMDRNVGGSDVCELSPDLAWMIVSHAEGGAKRIDLRSGDEKLLRLAEMVRRTKPDMQGVNEFKAMFFGQGRYVFLHLEKSVLAVVELASGEVVHQAEAAEVLGPAGDSPGCVCVLPNGSRRHVRFKDGILSHWSEDASTLAVSADGTLVAIPIAANMHEAEVQIRDMQTQEVKARLKGVQRPRFGLFSPDKRLLATSSEAGRPLEIWETDTGKRRFGVACDAEAMRPCVFSPDSRWLAGHSSRDPGKIVFFDLVTGQDRGEMANVVGRGLDRMTMRFLDDRRFVAHSRPRHFLNPYMDEASVVLLQPDQPEEAFLRVIFEAGSKAGNKVWMEEVAFLAPNGRLGARTNVRVGFRLGWFGRLWNQFVDPGGEGLEVSMETTVFDLQNGQPLCTSWGTGIVPGRFAKDAPIVVDVHLFEDNSTNSIRVWDVPFGRPWRWIVGVPLALGAALLGVRWTWRRWRGKRGV